MTSLVVLPLLATVHHVVAQSQRYLIIIRFMLVFSSLIHIHDENTCYGNSSCSSLTGNSVCLFEKISITAETVVGS